jgi:hypothetical protein
MLLMENVSLIGKYPSTLIDVVMENPHQDSPQGLESVKGVGTKG